MCFAVGPRSKRFPHLGASWGWEPFRNPKHKIPSLKSSNPHLKLAYDADASVRPQAARIPSAGANLLEVVSLLMTGCLWARDFLELGASGLYKAPCKNLIGFRGFGGS